jgi:hypothetical protein
LRVSQSRSRCSFQFACAIYQILFSSDLLDSDYWCFLFSLWISFFLFIFLSKSEDASRRAIVIGIISKTWAERKSSDSKNDDPPTIRSDWMNDVDHAKSPIVMRVPRRLKSHFLVKIHVSSLADGWIWGDPGLQLISDALWG